MSTQEPYNWHSLGDMGHAVSHDPCFGDASNLVGVIVSYDYSTPEHVLRGAIRLEAEEALVLLAWLEREKPVIEQTKRKCEKTRQIVDGEIEKIRDELGINDGSFWMRPSEE